MSNPNVNNPMQPHKDIRKDPSDNKQNKATDKSPLREREEEDRPRAGNR